MWFAVCMMWFAVCVMWFAVCVMWFAVCVMWFAVCVMWFAVCVMWFAVSVAHKRFHAGSGSQHVWVHAHFALVFEKHVSADLSMT